MFNKRWGYLTMKLNDKRISKDDLIEYTDNYSDFSFEMKVLNCFPDSYRVNHGGTYEDPISGKFREFDIRAVHSFDNQFSKSIYMAVEAKNLKESFPLLVSCVPRKKEEAYHDLIVSEFRGHTGVGYTSYGHIQHVKHTKNRLYNVGKFVGKSLDQVGRRDTRENELVGNDSDIYSKWSQAINSSFELADTAYYKSYDNLRRSFISFIMPIVVIPDKTLWVAKYDNEGNRVEEITQEDECQYFVGNKFELGDKISSAEIILSHLHIMTFSRFNKFINDIDTQIDIIFPKTE